MGRTLKPLLVRAAYGALTAVLLAACAGYAVYRSLLPAELPMRPVPTAPPLVRGAVRVLLGPTAREETARVYLDQRRELNREGYQKRRWRVAALARWLAIHWSDDEVAEAYATQVPMGDRVGLAAGAQRLFARPLAQLPPDEVALLMVVARAPEQMQPACHPDAAGEARNALLSRMADAQLVPPGALAALQAKPVAVLEPCSVS